MKSKFKTELKETAMFTLVVLPFVVALQMLAEFTQLLVMLAVSVLVVVGRFNFFGFHKSVIAAEQPC